MRIKRLDICGFKSFMDRAVFTFCDGVTAVVGPNGCGKSNVVDAIRWAMGEQSAKHLRGRSMEDVIFNGSETESPLGMAEVTITFYNDNPGLLPATLRDFPEISVTRRLFRNGESNYEINRTACRLLDVTELFLGTGVGTKAYSIIEQGRIGLIVSAKPEDRRSLIEEAAGITRYKSRRKAAERKMEYTEQNLLRVGDISAEIGRRLGVLERQARKAERYRAVKAQMREIELHAASLRFLELSVLSGAAQRAVDGLSDEERDLSGKVLAAEGAIEERRARLSDDEKLLAGLSEQLHRADNELKVGAANLEAYGREIEEAGRRIGEAEVELAQVAAATAALRAERADLEVQRASLSGLATDDDRRMLAVRDELARLAREEESVAGRLDSERALLVSALSRIAAGRSQLENLARRRLDLEGRLVRSQAERDGLRQREEGLEAARSGHLERLGTTRQLKLALEARRQGEEEALEAARREFAENEARLIGLREEMADRRSRLASLREIQKNYEGYGRGVRAVMARAGGPERAEGILGLVSDLVAAPPELERAVEAALGDRLQTVVVADRNKALELAGWLKDAREGRGAFLPLDLKPPAVTAPLEAGLPGVLGLARDLVRFDPSFAPLVEHLLGEVVVVRDLEAAIAWSRSGRSRTVVTLDGEVIEPTGAVEGGLLEGPGVGALQKKREIASLAEQVQAMAADLQLVAERQRRLGERSVQLDAALKGLSRDTHSEALSVVEQEKDLHKVSEDLAQARERIERVGQEIDDMQGTLSELAAEETSAAGGSAQAEGEREARETRVRELSGALAAARARIAELSVERTDLQVKVAADVERRDAVEKGLTRSAFTLAEVKEREARLMAIVGEAQQRRGALGEQIRTTRAGAEILGTELEGLGERQREARAAWEELSARVRVEEAELRQARKKLEELQGGLSQRSLEGREHALELAHLADSVRERHGVELCVELSRFHMDPQPSPEVQQTLAELREQVERMGEVNLTAIEEHRQLAERHQFLTTQKKDLEQSLVQLKRAIARINRTSKERFQQTFEAINEKFQQVFPRLFSGGRAGLSLMPSEDGGEPGIEILAQPPGKKLQSVNLLSGGEKALTAVSLIFAIFLIKPTPFCLLDEVDAPLDDANVGRYNDLVREMCGISQFILITHNKKTMLVADTLYGVTMEEPGVSKVVKVRLSEMAEHRAAPAASA